MIDEIYTGLRNFVMTFCTPPIGENVFRGNRNRYSLPVKNNFAIIWLANNMRRGTNIEDYQDFSVDIVSSRKILFQIDFYGDDGPEQANSFDVMYYSNAGINFLADIGLYQHYIDGIVQTAVVDAGQQYLTVTKISGWLGYTFGRNIPAQTAIELKINKSEVVE